MPAEQTRQQLYNDSPVDGISCIALLSQRTQCMYTSPVSGSVVRGGSATHGHECRNPDWPEGALQKVEQPKGVSYQRKTDGKHEIGLVAEDVNRVIPELVSWDPETHEVQGLDYSRMTALLNRGGQSTTSGNPAAENGD